MAVNRMPIYTVGAKQPQVTLHVAAGCGSFLPSTGTSAPIPATAQPSGGPDYTLVIYQPSTDSEWELWHATKNKDNSWTACWGGKLSKLGASDGVFPDGYGLSASGISYLATTITEEDIGRGSINHAIGMDIVDCDGVVPPADRTDCTPGSSPGSPREGDRFYLPPTARMPQGLTPFGKMVFTAMQKYGLVVMDQAGAVGIQAESASSWTGAGVDPITASWGGDQEWQALTGIPWGLLKQLA